jgi:outer membrane protein TolC
MMITKISKRLLIVLIVNCPFSARALLACYPLELVRLPEQEQDARIVNCATAQDSLQTYIQAALRENPEVMAKWHAYEAAIEAVCPAGTLGDPELSLNFYPKPMTQVNGQQVMSVSLMQMFPWFGAMKAAKSEKAWQAEAVWQKYREGGIQLAYELEQQWYKLLVTREKLSTLNAQLSTVKSLTDLSLYKYKNSTNSMKGTRMSDQYRLKAEQLKLQEQIESIESQLKLQQQQLNLLMHRSPDSPLVLPDSIVLSPMPVVEVSEIESRSPELLSLKAQGEQYLAQEEKAKRMGMPMVGIGVQYMLNKKRDMLSDGAMPDMNGMDMWMGMLKVTLPIYRHKIKAQQRAAQLMKQTTDEMYLRKVDVLHAQLLNISQRAEDVLRKLRLYKQDMDILDATLELMKGEYAAGTTSLSEILQTERELIDYAFRHAEARAQYNMIVVEFEKLASIQDYSKR